MWILAPAFIILGLAFGVLALTLVSSRTARFEVSEDGLRLRGDLWGRFISASALVTDSARRIDFSESPDLLPGRRTMGTGLPGYQAGWFRLKGGQTALVYLTDRSKAVLVPTKDNYLLLLSPDDPPGFLRALREVRARP
jgi:hypothetical protein